MNTEQERADFEAWFKSKYMRMPQDRLEAQPDLGIYQGYQAGRAALQSQDREDSGKLQAAARDMFVRASEIEVLYGTNKETEGLVMAAIRLAYLVGPSEQDSEDAKRYRYLISKLHQAYDGECFETDLMSIYCHMLSQYKGDRSIQAEITWRDKTDEPLGLSEAIDHARRIEGKGE